MHTSKLNVLANGISQDLAILSHSVHLDLLGMLDELRHHHRVILAHIGSQLQEALQLVFVRADIHGSTAEHIRGAHQHREPYPLYELVDIFHRGQRAPLGLVHTQLVEHLRELSTVFGAVDILSLSTQDGHMLLVKIHGQVIRNLTTRGHDDTMRGLHIDDIHHTLERQLIEVQTVAHIVVGRYRLRVIVYHH